jgi:hypothetical protein
MNIISYFIGGELYKAYIDFEISGVIVTDESDREKVMAELSKLIAKFVKNKNIIKLDSSFDAVDDVDFANLSAEVGEA